MAAVVKSSSVSLQTALQNGYDQDPYAKEFGIKVDNKLVAIEARVLPAPWVKCKTTHPMHESFVYVKLTICSLFTFNS